MIIKEIQNKYNFLDKLYLSYCFIRTKLIYRRARLIRFPIQIRGKRMIKIGKDLTTGINCRIEAFSTVNNREIKLYCGDRVQLNDNVHISAIESVKIGNDVLIASSVYISDNSHGSYKGDENDISPEIIPIKRPYNVEPVVIEDRVWIGEGVIIMPGIKIGKGAIIGAHSIVNRNIPANSIAVGAPIRIIKKWDNIQNKWLKI